MVISKAVAAVEKTIRETIETVRIPDRISLLLVVIFKESPL